MADRIDPFAGYNFSVELDGITRAGFRECSGLENSQNAGQYREGTDKNLAVRKIPGLVTHSDITLSRGISGRDELPLNRHGRAGARLYRFLCFQSPNPIDR